MDKDRQIYQLHKKGYEDLTKSISSLKPEKVKVELEGAEVVTIQGKPGQPGYSPIKGKDYFTKEDQKSIVSDVMSLVKIPAPIPGTPGKDAEPVDYKKIEKFVKSQVSKIEIPIPEPGKDAVVDYDSIIIAVLEKIPEVDLEPIKEELREEIRENYESMPRTRVLNSGGPTTRLGELVDVNIEGAVNHQVLTLVDGVWVPGSGAGLIQWAEIEGDPADNSALVTYIADQLATQDTLQEVTDNGATTTNDITVNSVTETVPTLLKLDQTTPQALTATDTTITASDEIYYGDATDSFKIKKDTIQGILDLMPSPDLSAYVPYIGATTDVDLGANDLTADSLITNKHIYLPDTDDLSGTCGIIYKANVPFIHNYHKLFATNGTTPLDGQNLFIGKDAGNFTMGAEATAAEHSSNNLGIGKESLKSLTIGYDNVGIGALSASAITTGRGNVYIGGNAGASTSALSYNVGIGQNSVKSAIAAGGNLVGVGYETLMSVQGGGGLSAFGTSAGRTMVGGSQGSFFGFKSGYYARGDASTFIGSEAGHGGSSTSSNGTFNTAMGYQALRSFTSGQRNTAIGQTAGYSISSGQRNTIVGSEAMYGLTTGSYNTAIGEGAGRYYSGGSSVHKSGTTSVFIGRNTRPLGNAQTNQIVIGESAIGKGSNTVTLGSDNITDTYLKGNVVMQDDNDAIKFGTGNDASMTYDGTNLLINPKVVGTGYLNIQGQTLVDDKLMFTQVGEYIDSLADGYMDYGATTAHRFNNPVFLANVKSGATQAGASASAGEVWKTSGHATLPDNVLMIGV